MRDVAAELDALELAAERLLAQSRERRWCPHDPTPKQAEFLALDADDALYGGAAGGGKSDALLMHALRGVDVPGYAALIVRRTYKDLALPGAIMDRAAEWLRPTAARWNEQKKEWRFPAGAVLAFGYCESENDKYRYQSAEFQTLCVDESTQFSESQYRYLRTRLRRLRNFPVRPNSRAASNPGGVGHAWVKARYVDPETRVHPFVPARLVDNPHIDQADYEARLEDLDETTRDQLLRGLWVVDASGLIYPYSHVNVLDDLPHMPGQWYYVLGIDLGAREDKPTTAFAVLGWHKRLRGVFVLESAKHAGLDVTGTREKIEAYSRQYGGFVRMPMDEGALGKAFGTEYRMRFALPVEPAEKQSKLGYRKLLRGALERAEVMIVAPTNEQLLEEMGELRWSERHPGTREDDGVANHLTDALLYGWRAALGYAAVPPTTGPRPGSTAAIEAEMAEQLEAERQEIGAQKRDRRRNGRKRYWQR